MAAIGRRALFAIPALLWAAEERDEIREVLAAMATDLSAGNAAGFLGHLDRKAAAFEEWRADVVRLMSLGEISSSVEILDLKGEGESRTASVDWYYTVTGKSDGAIMVQRRDTLTMEFAREKKTWKVTAFRPADFFRAPAA